MKSKAHPVIQSIRSSFLLLSIAVGLVAHPVAAQSGWADPIIISGDAKFSWFPDIAVDPYSNVHITWCESTRLQDGGEQEQVLYSYYDGSKWSPPNDLTPPNRDIARNAITADQKGVLHMIYGGTSNNTPLRILYTQSPVKTAWSAKSWSTPEVVNLGISYAGDIETDSHDRLHMVIDDVNRQANDISATNLSDISYRQSDDGGITWSRSKGLFPEPSTGSARSALTVDGNDILHVTWDEGWDRITGKISNSLHGVYISSADRGATWSTAKIIDYPSPSVVQTTAGSNNHGGVMLVWRSTTTQSLYYQWSTDGKTWGDPMVFQTVNARPYSSPFDRYEMATDSAGHIHLIIVGSLTATPSSLGVFQLVWDGETWSQPELIYQDDVRMPEYPRIKIAQGNQVYAAWFTRELGSNGNEVRHVWYTHAQASAPRLRVTPIPSNTMAPSETPTLAAQLTATLSPSSTIVFVTPKTQLMPGLPVVYKENDYLRLLGIILAPVIVGLLAFFAFIRLRGKR